MHQRITTLKPKKAVMPHETIQRNIDGRLIQIPTPKFHVKATYVVPKDMNYKTQQNRALRQYREEHPDIPTPVTAHHGIASPDKNTVPMEVVLRKEHQGQSHYGGSAINCDRWCKERIEEASNWDIPKSEQIANKISHSMHKHSTATSTTVGAVSGVAAGGAAIGLYHWWCKKQGQEPTKKGYAVCATFGAISGVVAGIATKQHLNTGIRYI